MPASRMTLAYFSVSAAYRIDRKARVNNEDRWPPDGSADWHEALLAPAEVRVHMWVGHGRGAKESPRISVRLGTRDLVPGEVPACARFCFDHDRLVPNLGKLVRNDARGDVDNSTRRIGHDHVDMPVRKVALRMRPACHQHPSRRRPAECSQQLPPSDGDCHTPLPCEVRKGKDTTPRWCSLHVQGGQD